MILFLCYDRCSTCQKAENWLKENSISYTRRSIKDDNPNAAELKEWAELSGFPAKRFFNTSGLLYKQLALKDKLPQMSKEEMLSLLASDGMLVKRPLLIADDFILVGFRLNDWQTAFSNINS